MNFNKLNSHELLNISNTNPYEFWTWFTTIRFLSNSLWDVYSYECYKHYAKKNCVDSTPKLSSEGFITGILDLSLFSEISKLYDNCEDIKFFGQDFSHGYFFEPRRNVHDYFNITNTYKNWTDDFKLSIESSLNSIKTIIEKACGHNWSICSSRLFSLQHGTNTGAVHKDGWPYAIKKLFIFPDGASLRNGTTLINTKSGSEIFLELPPGGWVLFEQNLVSHQATLPSNKLVKPRRTIELDIYPSFETDTRISYAGLNGWYPWFPNFQESANSCLYCPSEFDYTAISERMDKRTMGLFTIFKPLDFSMGADEYFSPPANLNKTNYEQNLDENQTTGVFALIKNLFKK